MYAINDNHCSPIVSSRIRLARNIANRNFPMMLSAMESEAIIEEIVKIFIEDSSLHKKFDVNILKELDTLKLQELVENHLMSPNLFDNALKGALIVSKDKRISIMINEEDHIRIQSIEKGFQLDEAFKAANDIDDVLEERLGYAFDEMLGFLTSCVTNVGTGLRASAMLHLPALRVIGELNKIIQMLSKIGFTVRGTYGEGSEALGNMFQISNQITLGVSEQEIIKAVTNIVNQLVEKEKKARAVLLEKDRVLVEDKIYRSFGILKNARLLSYKESMMLLSDVILGAHMGILTEVNKETLYHTINCIQPASLQLKYDEKMSDRERDVKRAELIKELITNN